MAISKRTRFEVLRRDNHTCRYCGHSAPDVKLTVDHVTPKTLGGPDTPDNLVTACQDCNAGKASTSPDETLVADISDKTQAWITARHKAMQQIRAERKTEEQQQNKTISQFYEDWQHITRDPDGRLLPDGWEDGVTYWADHGLEPEDFRYAIDVAYSSRCHLRAMFKYAMGVAKNISNRADDLAHEIVTSGDSDVAEI